MPDNEKSPGQTGEISDGHRHKSTMNSLTHDPENVKQETIRVGLYERVSSQEQAQHGVSLDEQAERLDLFAKLEGWRPYDHYRDEGVSGGTDDRPQLQRLMADARAGRIDLVVVTKLDRFFRNTRLLLNYIHELEGYGVGFVAQSEGVDTRKPGIGKIILSLLGSIAEWERERIGQRVSDFRQHLARQGRWSSGRPPFGYRFDKDSKELVIDKLEAEAIRFAYTTYTSQQLGLIRLAEAMNAGEQLTPRMGKRKCSTWTQSAVRHILTHPAYKGGPNETWQFKCPAIVEPEVWEAVQRRLASNQHFKPATSGCKSRFRGKLHCGLCGHTLRVGYSHNTKAVYECPGRLKRLHLDGSARCVLPRFEVPNLDDTLWQKIDDLCNNPDMVVEFIHKTIANLDNERSLLKEKLLPLNEEEARLKEELTICDARLEMKRISPEVYKKRVRELDGQLRRLEERKRGIDPFALRDLKYNQESIDHYQYLLRSVTEWGNKEDILSWFADDRDYEIGLGMPGKIQQGLTALVFADHTELKGNIKVGQSNVSPTYKNDIELPLSIRIELPELASILEGGER